MLIMLTLLLGTAATVVPGAIPVTAQERGALRDACSKVRGGKPVTPATRAAFKACVAQIPYDGDLPPHSGVHSKR